MILSMVIYAVFVGLLVAAAVIDIQSFRIPNAIIIALCALWAVWRILLGVANVIIGADFGTGFLSSAPLAEVSFADGIIGGILFGGILLIVTTVYDAVTKKPSMGGGDIKLLAAAGLFLGIWRGLICLLVACVMTLVLAFFFPRARWGDKSMVADPDSAHPLLRGVPLAPSILVGAFVALLIP